MKYSIIIPHHNSQESLIRCIDSIPDREDIQVIVVDDCSDPDAVDFDYIEKITKRRFEIEILDRNSGAGKARNVGIDRAKGEWLLFADSDDYFLPQMETILDNAVGDSDADVILFDIDSEGNMSQQGKRYSKLINDYDGTAKSLTDVKYRSWSPWAKLYKKSLIDKYKLRFEHRKKGNDCFFVLNAMLRSVNTKVVKQAVYHLTYSANSLSHSKTGNWEYMYDVYDLWLWRYRFYRDHGIELWKEYNVIYLLKEVYNTFGFWHSVNILLRSFDYKYDHWENIVLRLKK